MREFWFPWVEIRGRVVRRFGPRLEDPGVMSPSVKSISLYSYACRHLRAVSSGMYAQGTLFRDFICVFPSIVW
jgi:hypothetical protein